MNQNRSRLAASALLALTFTVAGSAAGADQPESSTTTTVAPGVKLETQAVPRVGTAPAATGEAVRGPGVRRDALEDRGQRLRELEQARGLEHMRELPLGAAHLPERGSLTDPAGVGLGRRDNGRLPGAGNLGGRDADDAGFKNPMGRLAPDLPSNRDKTRDFGLGPSANPRDWMSGSASQGGTTTRRVSHGPTTDIITTKRDGDGNVIRQQRATYDSSDGSFINSVTTERNADGSERTTTLTRTGEVHDMRTGQRTVIVEETRETRDASGNVTGSTTIPGRVLGQDKHDPAPVDRGGIARMVDPNADTGDASVCHAMPWVCRGAPATDPNRVNPGRDQGGFVPAPRINPGDSIVVNPSTEQIRGANQAREFGVDDARRTVGQGTHVNPPGPND